MKKVAILGAGRVGSAIVEDLYRDCDITVFDNNQKVLTRIINTYPDIGCVCMDAKAAYLLRCVCDFDLVVSAMPGNVGFGILRSLISAGQNVVDISFFPEDPNTLDELAREKDVTVVVDCGIAPGLDNMMAGFHSTQMRVDSFLCLVGGLPAHPIYPFNYKAPWSPEDVIEEYLRPARFVEEGIVKEVPALSEVELLNFSGIGTLEAFYTDGLRTLVTTMKNKIPNMREKTLRYPGHAEFIKQLKAIGLFDQDLLPRETLSKIMASNWKLENGEDEFTVMRVVMKGVSTYGAASFNEHRVSYEIIDRFDKKTGLNSMARTTGFTCSAVARLVLEGKIKQKGILAPEHVGMDEECFNTILLNLRERGINIEYTKQTRPISLEAAQKRSF